MSPAPPRSTPTDTPFPYTTRFRAFPACPGGSPGRSLRIRDLTMMQADALVRLRSAEFRAVGTNQTAKAIGRGRAQVVYIAKDADRRVVEGRSEEHTSELQSLMRTSYAVLCSQTKTHINREHS